VYNQEPNFTREGGSIPVTLTLEDHLQANVLLLPMGRGDDGAQSVLCNLFSARYDLIIIFMHSVRRMRKSIGQTSSMGCVNSMIHHITSELMFFSADILDEVIGHISL
jgi:hypothetical protein